MSTKRLSRSYAEAGHSSEQRDFSREAVLHSRRAWNLFTRRLVRNPELWHSDEPEPMRRVGGHPLLDGVHDSNFGPVDRWLKSQIGRSWDEAYSQLRQGLRCHGGRNHDLLDSIQLAIEGARLPGDLYVDEQGILRELT